MPKNSFIRRERKFLLTKDKYRRLLPVLSEHMKLDPYCTDDSGYIIRNIYYDTDNDDVIKYSLSSPYHKEKLRLRFYEEPKDDESPLFLELKKKTDGIVTKRRVTMKLSELEDFFGTQIPPEREKYVDKQIFNELAAYISANDVKPKVYLSYKRIAFFDDEDPSLRLTFDYDITAKRFRDDKDAERNVSLIDDDMMLMEIKFSHAVPLWMARMLSENNIRKTSFSKYGTEYKNEQMERLLSEDYGGCIAFAEQREKVKNIIRDL